MSDQKRDVYIEKWPKEPAKLEHDFKSEKPCPVSISFENASANVAIQTSPKEPFNVNMNMNVRVEDQLPVCVRLCEPICAKSDYTVGLEIFDRPVASITIKGMTRIFNCEEPSPFPRVCTSFQKLKEGMVIHDTISIENLTFKPINGQLKVISWGDPPGENKIVFQPEGVSVNFPYPVNSVMLNVGNYTATDLYFTVFSNDQVVKEFTKTISNEVMEIVVEHTDITSIVVAGGKEESYIAEVCYQ